MLRYTITDICGYYIRIADMSSSRDVYVNRGIWQDPRLPYRTTSFRHCRRYTRVLTLGITGIGKVFMYMCIGTVDLYFP